MRSRIYSVLLGLAMGWAVLGVTACASFAPRVEKPAKRPPGFYTPSRWMGLLKKGSVCPTVPGWKTQTLLELAAAHAKDGVRKKGEYAALPELARENLKEKEKLNAIFHKHGLDRYCVFTSQGHGPEFQKPACLVRADPDRMALIASAPDDPPLADQVREPLAEQFLNQVGSVQLGYANKPTVRLVFFDSYPTDDGVPTQFNPVSAHGYGMAHLANEIVCGTAAGCPIQIATRLALRYDGYNPNPYSTDNPGSDLGGRQGRIGDLATQIAAEILYWHSDTTPSRPKLILNFSIGWDGEYHEADLDKEQMLDTWTQAVYHELESAHDAGVLMIAAAGNRSGGEDSHQALLPAAWESQCPDGPCGEKIIYAVGGVDWQGLPLPNARPSGMPELVAYADHAVVNGDVHTGIYTGSSVAAAVASSIAAVAWHLKPDLTPALVIDQMASHPNPNPISGTATFYPPWKSQPSLKWLSLRQTVTSLCTQQACPDVTPQPQGTSPADLSAITTQVDAAADQSSTTAFPDCGEQDTVYFSSVIPPNKGCPIETLPDMGTPAMIQPQPEEIPCPPCNIAPAGTASARVRQVASLLPPAPEAVGDPKPYTLAAALDPDWAAVAHDKGTTIESAILVIDCTSDPIIKERVDVTTQFKNLYTTPSDSVRINFGPVGERTTLAGCTASVDFTLSVTINDVPSLRSAQSPVYVDP